MPSLTVNTKAIKRKMSGTIIADLAVTIAGSKKNLMTSILFSKINTPEKFANWLMHQVKSFSDTSSAPEVNRQFIIEYHNETGTDEDGNPYPYRVIDNVISRQLPVDEYRLSLVQLDGMGGTPDEAAQYVNDTVTNLVTAKKVIADQAKAIMLLQQQLDELRIEK